MFCSKCGAELPEGSMTCPACDAVENAAEIETVVSEQTTVPKKKSKLGIIAAVVVLIAVGVAAFLFFGGKETESVDPVVGKWEVQTIETPDGEEIFASELSESYFYYVYDDGTIYSKAGDAELELTWSPSERLKDGSLRYPIGMEGVVGELGGMLLDKGGDVLIIGLAISDSEEVFYLCTRAD